jgi:hypothetical protein
MSKHTPAQFGVTVGADFDASTMTLEMEPGYRVAVGPVAVLDRALYNELLAAAKQAEKWIKQEMEENWPADRVANPPAGSHLFNLRAAIARATGAEKPE